MSTTAPSTPGVLREHATLEILWQQDVSATVFARAADGSLSPGALVVGIPAVSDLADLGQGATGRRIGLSELIALAADPPAGLEPGGSARATFAVLELARRSVSEGLVHPQLQQAGRAWLAYWGATIDDEVQRALDAIAARPARRLRGRVRRRRTRARARPLRLRRRPDRARPSPRRRVRLGRRLLRPPERARAPPRRARLGRARAAAAAGSPHSSGGCHRLGRQRPRARSRRAVAPQPAARRARGRDDETELVLELWLQAADDPTLILPVSLLGTAATRLRVPPRRRPADGRARQLG